MAAASRAAIDATQPGEESLAKHAKLTKAGMREVALR